MALTTADIGIQLLIDSTVNLQEIESRMTARVFAAVHHPERGPAVRAVLEQLLAVLDATSPDGVIAALLPCPALGPFWMFPRRMGRGRNLGGSGGPPANFPRHAAS